MEKNERDIIDLIASSKDPCKALQIALELARKFVELKGSTDNE